MSSREGALLHRTQILLDEQQIVALRRLASERGVSVAQLIREAVSEALDRRNGDDLARVRQRAAAAAGRFRSGRRDVAERHDDHLAEAFRS